MKKEWIDWFVKHVSNKEFTLENIPYFNIKRNYSFYNINSSDVPFHSEFFEYLKKYTGIDDFTFDIYHIHRWVKGSFFSKHIDNRDNRKFAYVYELQESECKTKLLVNNNSVNEGWFDVHTNHEVPTIISGERISLTVFGKNFNNTKGYI